MHLFYLKQFGEHIYYMPKKVSDIFQATDVNIPCDLIKLPSKSMYFHMEDQNFTLGLDGKNHIKNLYVTEDIELDGEHLMHIMVNYVDEKCEKSSFYFHLHLNGSKERLSSLIQAIHRRVSKNINSNNPDKQWIDDGDKDITSEAGIAAISKFVVVTLLYLTGQEPDLLKVKPEPVQKRLDNLTNKKKKRLLEKKYAGITKKSVMVIGKNMPELTMGTGTSRVNFTIEHKYLVRGHFRNQPVGPREAGAHKHIWIAPFYKGPENTELKPKAFVFSKDLGVG